ncbi:hypothetical protein MNEG_2900, partial [Monoraphidium neglectum]
EALASHRREAAAQAAAREVLEREARDLRAQLEASQRQLALLSRQPPQQQQQQQQQLPAPLRSPLQAAATTPTSAGNKVPRLPLDRCPSRDQDAADSPARAAASYRASTGAAHFSPALTPPSSAKGAGRAARAHTASRHAASLGADTGTPVAGSGWGAAACGAGAGSGGVLTPRERESGMATARSTASTCSLGAVTPAPHGTAPAARGSSSAQRHADRLQSARLRAAGVFSSPAAAPGAAGSPTAALAGFKEAGVAGAARQLTGAANRGSAGGKPARLGSTAPAVSESVSAAAPARGSLSARPSGSTWASKSVSAAALMAPAGASAAGASLRANGTRKGIGAGTAFRG